MTINLTTYAARMTIQEICEVVDNLDLETWSGSNCVCQGANPTGAPADRWRMTRPHSKREMGQHIDCRLWSFRPQVKCALTPNLR